MEGHFALPFVAEAVAWSHNLVLISSHCAKRGQCTLDILQALHLETLQSPQPPSRPSTPPVCPNFWRLLLGDIWSLFNVSKVQLRVLACPKLQHRQAAADLEAKELAKSCWALAKLGLGSGPVMAPRPRINGPQKGFWFIYPIGS